MSAAVDAGLARASDETLVLAAGRAHIDGAAPAATSALRLLVWRHAPAVLARVSLRVAPDDVDDVAHDALVRGIDDQVARAEARLRGGAGSDPEAPGVFSTALHASVDASVAAWRRRQGHAAAPGVAGAHEDDDALWAAGTLLEGGTVAEAAAELDPALAELRTAFAAEFAHDPADADPVGYLAQADGARRGPLAAALDLELRAAPTRAWDAGALAWAHEDELAQRVVASLVEGVEAWPRLLPRLRRRAGLDPAALAAGLAGALGVPDGVEAVAGHYAAMEAGERRAEQVTERVLEALAVLLDCPAEVLRRAGTPPGQAPPPPPHEPDDPTDVDALFRSGAG